jgi:hypothetical protein
MEIIQLSKVTKATVALWEAQQVESHKDNYTLIPDEPVVMIPKTDWEHIERSTEFGVYNLIQFEKNGKLIKFPVRYNAIPKPGVPMYIKNYECIDGFTAGNGTVVEPGKTKFYVTM